MDLVQWQRLKVNSQCSQSTLDPLESNGQVFDLKMLSVFLGFLSILLSYSSLFVSQRLSETCRVGDSQCIRICLV